MPLSPDIFRSCGRELHRIEWQHAMARQLGPLDPVGAREAVDERLVRRWASGKREVPDWVRMAAEGESWRALADRLERLATEIASWTETCPAEFSTRCSLPNVPGVADDAHLRRRSILDRCRAGRRDDGRHSRPVSALGQATGEETSAAWVAGQCAAGVLVSVSGVGLSSTGGSGLVAAARDWWWFSRGHRLPARSGWVAVGMHE